MLSCICFTCKSSRSSLDAGVLEIAEEDGDRLSPARGGLEGQNAGVALVQEHTSSDPSRPYRRATQQELSPAAACTTSAGNTVSGQLPASPLQGHSSKSQNLEREDRSPMAPAASELGWLSKSLWSFRRIKAALRKRSVSGVSSKASDASPAAIASSQLRTPRSSQPTSPIPARTTPSSQPTALTAEATPSVHASHKSLPALCLGSRHDSAGLDATDLLGATSKGVDGEAVDTEPTLFPISPLAVAGASALGSRSPAADALGATTPFAADLETSTHTCTSIVTGPAQAVPFSPMLSMDSSKLPRVSGAGGFGFSFGGRPPLPPGQPRAVAVGVTEVLAGGIASPVTSGGGFATTSLRIAPAPRAPRAVRMAVGARSPRLSSRRMLLRQGTPYARRLVGGGTYLSATVPDGERVSGGSAHGVLLPQPSLPPLPRWLRAARGSEGATPLAGAAAGGDRWSGGSASRFALTAARTEPHSIRTGPRFVAGSEGGDVVSPRPRGVALLNRQQTPYPLYAAGWSWWDASQDGTGTAYSTAGSAALPRALGTGEIIGGLLSRRQTLDGGASVDGSLDTLPYRAAPWARAGSQRSSRGRLACALSPGPGACGARGLRVQLSLAKSRRTSTSLSSSMLSLAAVPAAGGGEGGGDGPAVPHGNHTPTRHGRRRNLAGNEDLLWDIVPRRALGGAGYISGTPQPAACSAGDAPRGAADPAPRYANLEELLAAAAAATAAATGVESRLSAMGSGQAAGPVPEPTMPYMSYIRTAPRPPLAPLPPLPTLIEVARHSGAASSCGGSSGPESAGPGGRALEQAHTHIHSQAKTGKAAAVCESRHQAWELSHGREQGEGEEPGAGSHPAVRRPFPPPPLQLSNAAGASPAPSTGGSGLEGLSAAGSRGAKAAQEAVVSPNPSSPGGSSITGCITRSPCSQLTLSQSHMHVPLPPPRPQPPQPPHMQPAPPARRPFAPRMWGRATHSCDGRSGLPCVPLPHHPAAHQAFSPLRGQLGATHAAAGPLPQGPPSASAPSMPRAGRSYTSLSSLPSPTPFAPLATAHMLTMPGGGEAGTYEAYDAAYGMRWAPGGGRSSRRALRHAGSVRSAAPTEDDSAESLAKLTSECDAGGASDKLTLPGSGSAAVSEPIGFMAGNGGLEAVARRAGQESTDGLFVLGAVAVGEEAEQGGASQQAPGLGSMEEAELAAAAAATFTSGLAPGPAPRCGRMARAASVGGAAEGAARAAEKAAAHAHMRGSVAAELLRACLTQAPAQALGSQSPSRLSRCTSAAQRHEE